MLIKLFVTFLCLYVIVSGKSVTHNHTKNDIEDDLTERELTTANYSGYAEAATYAISITVCKNEKVKCLETGGLCFEHEERTISCKCPSKTEYVTGQGCRATCKTNPCQNGGTCSVVRDNIECKCYESFTGELCEKVNYCALKCGTTEGVICSGDPTNEKSITCKCKDKDSYFSTADKVCKINYCLKKCGTDEGVICMVNLNNEKDIRCSCKNRLYHFDETDKRCRVSETCNDEKRCHNGGKCTVREDYSFCVCPHGTSGRLCEIVDECVKDIGICKDGSKCAFDVQKGKAVCMCPHEGEKYDSWTERCKKTCSKKACTNGKCIVNDEGTEQCICPAGYTLKNDMCIRGSCRPDTCFGGRCQTVDGELLCECPEKFHLDGIGCFETVCKTRRCFGGKCVVESNQEICICRKGYRLVNDVCKKILCQEKGCFGGQCHILNGKDECTCPVGYTLFEGVCRENK